MKFSFINNTSAQALKIALIFFVFSFLWILFSDRLLLLFIREAEKLTQLQTYKGWFYVTTASVILFYFVLIEINKKEKELTKRIEIENRYHLLSENINDVIFSYNISDNSFEYISNNVKELFGYSQKEWLETPNMLQKVLPPKSNDNLLSVLDEIKSGDLQESYDYQIYHKNGTLMWANQRSIVIRDKNNKPTHIEGFVSDITKRKKDEEKTKSNEERYHALFEYSTDAIMLLRGSKFVECNKRTFELFKCNPEDIINNYPYVFSPENQPDGQLSKSKALSYITAAFSGQPQAFEWEHKKKTGETFSAEVRLNKFQLAGDDYLFATVRDVSNNVKIKEEIIKHRNNLEQMVSERTHEIEALNEELQQTNEELLVTNEQLHKQKDVLEKALKKLKETQEKLVQSEKMASIGMLTAGIAHEINNPVNFISSSVQAIVSVLENIVEIDKQYKLLSTNNFETKIKEIEQLKDQMRYDRSIELLPSAISSIKVGIDRTTEIIKGLRFFTRSEESVLEPTDIHASIDTALVILKNKYKNKIKIQKKYTELPLFNCVAGKITQVFMNVISNGIDSIYMKNELTEDERITITTLHQDNSIKISIADTGVGISSKNIKSIFEPFFTTKKVGEGTGLGLFISNGIIHEYEGTIKVKSEKNKGAQFYITLPLKL